MGKRRSKDSFLVILGKAFKKVREERGLTQGEVLTDTGIHVGRIEIADRGVSVTTVEKLCKYYGIGLVDFFRIVEEAN